MNKYEAIHALSYEGFFAQWMGPEQRVALKDCLHGEEGDYFIQKLSTLKDHITAMPMTYGQDGLGMDAIVHLHYFRGAMDWYITEKDIGAPLPHMEQRQAFGYANLGDPDNAEMGYISIQELIENGVELDLYWKVKKLKEVVA